MRYSLLFLLLLFNTWQIQAQKLTRLYSPDRKLMVSVFLNEKGELFYDIYHQDSLVMKDSRLGVSRADADFTSGLKLLSVSPVKAIKESYTLQHGKKKQVNYGGLFLKEDSGGSFEVVTLDTLLLPQLERLDFIKMDVQGFEPKVIKGARQVISRFKPVIQIECMEKKMLNEEIIPLMTELGYRITRVLEIDYLFEPVA